MIAAVVLASQLIVQMCFGGPGPSVPPCATLIDTVPSPTIPGLMDDIWTDGNGLYWAGNPFCLTGAWFPTLPEDFDKGACRPLPAPPGLQSPTVQ